MDAPSLDHLRQEIDVIDRELHGLIRRRAELVDKITASKPNGGLAIRPGREARVLRQRLAAHQGAFPAAAYWDLARDHFGCQMPLVGFESPGQVLAEVRSSPTTVGVVPAPIEADTAPWWPLLASGESTLPNVVARLPFLAMPNARARGISALVLARIEPEESGDDRALISIETPSGISRNRIASALAAAGLPAFTSALDQLAAGVHHYLVELPGVIADGDKRLSGLEAALKPERGRVASIGAYASPTTL